MSTKIIPLETLRGVRYEVTKLVNSCPELWSKVIYSPAPVLISVFGNKYEFVLATREKLLGRRDEDIIGVDEVFSQELKTILRQIGSKA